MDSGERQNAYSGWLKANFIAVVMLIGTILLTLYQASAAIGELRQSLQDMDKRVSRVERWIDTQR